MDCSFTPQGTWFVFCTETGRTLRLLKTKTQAVTWIARELWGSK